MHRPSTHQPRVEVERFSLHSANTGRTDLYEAGDDLTMRCREALGGGEYAGVVLIGLGIDGNDLHRVAVDKSRVSGPGDGYEANDDDPVVYAEHLDVLQDAAQALQAVQERLEVIEGPGAAQEAPVRGIDATLRQVAAEKLNLPTDVLDAVGRYMDAAAESAGTPFERLEDGRLDTEGAYYVAYACERVAEALEAAVSNMRHAHHLRTATA